VLGLGRRTPLARCVLALRALLAALGLILSRALLSLTRSLAWRFPLATLLGPLGLPLGALVLLRALGLPAVALSRLLVFRAGGPATLVFRARGPATRHALG